MQDLMVAAAQIAPVLGQIEENLKKHLDYIAKARSQKVDVVVFPELSLTGYELDEEDAVKIARQNNSKEVLTIAKASEGITTIFGFVELGFAAQLHNSSIAVRDNRVLFLHRKLNLPNYGKLIEGKLFGSGRCIDTFDLHDPWFGSILLCADAWNPGLVHLVAVKGATLLTIPTNSAYGTIEHGLFSNPAGWNLLVQFYSYVYGLPTVVVNRVGIDEKFKFCGGSKIFGPNGEMLAEAGEEEETLIFAQFKYNEIVKARANLPTVRDSNLDLIHRETVRVWNSIGRPTFVDG